MSTKSVFIVWRKHKDAPGSQHVGTVNTLAEVDPLIAADKVAFAQELAAGGVSTIDDYQYSHDVQRLDAI